MNEREWRLTEFRRAPLAWLLVRHFLPAPLLEELARAVVAAVTDDPDSLDALVDSCVTPGPTPLAGWAAKPRPVEGVLDRHLQSLIRCLIWKGDQTPGPYEPDVAPEQKRRLADIREALELAHGDLTTILADAQRSPPPAALQPAFDAMATLRSALEAGGSLDVDAIEGLLANGPPSPLPSLLLKHLGDLAADLDAWDEALAIYLRVRDRIADLDEPAWQPLVDVAEILVRQSCAMALWATKGPAAAAPVLQELVEQASLAERPIAFFNTAHDAMNAHSAMGEWPDQDERGGLIAAPQLIMTYDSGHALESTVKGQFRDAHRWFWATLRRQTALGVTTESRTTRSQFGRALLDDIERDLGRDHHPSDFLMATRLLVGSGHDKAIEAARWDEKLIARYVTVEAVQDLSRFAARHAGTSVDRNRVLAALFLRWLEKIPAEHTGPAKAMMSKLSELARSGAFVGFTNRNIGGAAMRALRQIGRSRPEFRSIAIEHVEAAIRSALAGNGRAVEAAIETAETFAAHLQPHARKEIVDLVIGLLEDSGGGTASRAILRPALNLLSSDAVFELIGGTDLQFARRAAQTLLRASLDAETERIRVMYLLRDLDPALIEDQIDQDRLDETVASLAEAAATINSSVSAGSIQALLVAPAVAGRRNVEHAIECLGRILSKAAESDRAPLAFAEAYSPLLVLARNHASIADALNLERDAFVQHLRALEAPLVEMWEKAGQRPLIFTGFALPPPTEPNRVVVHNWTFSSLAFARAIDRVARVDRAIGSAAQNQRLSSAIAIARAIRTEEGGARSDEDIEQETGDVFYAALGRRLMSLKALSEEDRREQVARLLQRCLEVGPSGLDVGIFVAADALGIRVDRSSRSDVYVERVGRDPALRHGLLPFLEMTIVD